MPCNRKIRIFDYKLHTVDSILKDGFNDYYFKNEVNVRTKEEYSFVPSIIIFGDRWYRENIIEGRGLVRINKKYYGTYCNKVIDDLRTISTKTLHYISANIYSQQLVDNITSKIQFFSEKKQIVSTGYLYYILHKAESILSNSDISIPLVFSHGDLQTGNIWVNQTTNRVTLLDWETAKERSLWYDCATLLLSIRRKNMFSAMVSNMNDTNIIGDLLLLDTKKDYNMKTVMATLILEEMTFFVDEIFDLPDSLGAEIIDRFIYEMKHIKWIN
jgi:thiamine kinase-like enzyme